MLSLLRSAVLPALALAVLAPTAAEARPAIVHATVTVRNTTASPLKGLKLKVELAAGSRLNGHHGTVTVGLKAVAAHEKRTLRLSVHGKRPKAFSIGSTACASHAHGHTLAVTCTLKYQTGEIPGPPAPTTAPAPAAAPAASSAYAFAPYADMAAWPPPELGASGAKRVSLGFVTAGSGCTPTWGGYAAYPAGGAGAYRLAEVNAFRASGGDVVISFGGASGTDLAQACMDVPSLTAAYKSVIDAYGATHVDFDIEGAALTDTAANARRAQAVAALGGMIVSYTLPVDPTGLDANGLAVLRSAPANLGLVNVMAMDYGDAAAPSPAGKMGAYAIQAGEALRGQLAAQFPGKDVSRMIGVTPMIGINDVADEVFTLDDANQLVAWAAAQHIGMLGMWSLGRDGQCPSPATTASTTCSGVAQSPFDFAHALGAFQG